MARRQPYHYGPTYGNPNGYNNGGFQEQLPDNENDYLVDGLRTKVTALKSLTLDMGDEIKSQNAFLSDMDNEMDSAWGRLSSSMFRVKKIAMSGQNRHIFYLLAFSMFVFFVIYLIIRLR